jgi:DNA repair protein RecO (recombination protein O)
MKTEGIVLSLIKYKETSIITKIYTEQLGLRTYIVNGIRSNRSRGKSALYQPLSILELDVYEQINKNIQRISEAKSAVPYRSIPFDISKTTVAIFLSEVLTKLLMNDEQRDSRKYKFIATSLEFFDSTIVNTNTFHIQFLAKMAKFSGIQITSIHNLLDQIRHICDIKVSYLDQVLIDQLLASPYDHQLKLSSRQRQISLNLLLEYYQLHENHLGNLNSLEILQEVFRD